MVKFSERNAVSYTQQRLEHAWEDFLALLTSSRWALAMSAHQLMIHVHQPCLLPPYHPAHPVMQGETKADSSAPPTQNAPAHRVAPSMPADVSLSPAADSAHIQQPADSAPPAAAGLLGGVQPTGDNSIPAGCTGSPAVQQAVRQVQAAQSALEDIKSGPSEVTAHVPGDSPPLAPSSAAAQPTADPARGPCVAVHTGSLNSQPAVRQASSPGDALEAGAGEGLPQSAAADVQMDLSRPLQPAVASTLPAAEPCLPQQVGGAAVLHIQGAEQCLHAAQS